jgi:hypothetical protein
LRQSDAARHWRSFRNGAFATARSTAGLATTEERAQNRPQDERRGDEHDQTGYSELPLHEQVLYPTISRPI